METKVKHSTKLVCGALLASVMGAAEIANATPTTIDMHTFATRTGVPSFSSFTGTHTFGGAPTILGAVRTGGFYTQTVTSGLSQRPGWSYDLNVDYAGFGTSYFQGGGWSFVIEMTVNGDSGAIGAVQAKDHFGNLYQSAVISHTANTISVSVSADQVIAGGNYVTVQWSVPAPGGLALLGLVGAVGSRRRRA